MRRPRPDLTPETGLAAALQGSIPPLLDYAQAQTARIEVKKLRYLLEVFQQALPAALVHPVLRTLKAAQKTLGEAHDLSRLPALARLALQPLPQSAAAAERTARRLREDMDGASRRAQKRARRCAERIRQATFQTLLQQLLQACMKTGRAAPGGRANA